MPSDLTVTDQLGRQVNLPFPPERIISVVPSQTELLYHLGLDDQVMGITKFCIHPQSWHQAKVKVGGTKQLNIELIKSLKPDLVIANKEENEQSQIEELMRYFPVWVSDIHDLGSAIEMIKSVGDITGKTTTAGEIADQINDQFHQIKPLSVSLSTLYFIWRKPYMLAGDGTFINHLLNYCGFQNAIHAQRYPELPLTWKGLQPEVILLSSEPYPFNQSHAAELAELFPNALVLLVDGEMFSWYGSRLLKSASYLQELINWIENQRIIKNLEK